MTGERIGPGSPPRQSRFQKGKSGNPQGRPKSPPKARASIFDVILDKPFTITRNGIERAATVDEALQWQTYVNALSGNRAACREVLKWISEYERARAKQIKPHRVERKISGDPDNADEAMLLLGIAQEDTSSPNYWEGRRLRLDTWFVQKALSRRRGGHMLTAKDISDIKRCTQRADLLRWPTSYDDDLQE